MAETSWPYDSQLSYEDNWREMASKWLGDGVLYGELNNLAISGDSTGMNVKEATGKAWVKGTFYSNDAIRTLTVAAAPSSGNTRRDRVVLRNDFVANSTTAQVLPGTVIAIPGTPAAPGLTRSTTVWDVPLGQVLVPAGTVTIGPSAITDDRAYAVPLNSPFAAPTSAWSGFSGTLPTPAQAPTRLRITGGQNLFTTDANGVFYVAPEAAVTSIVSVWAVSGDMNTDAGFFVPRPDWPQPGMATVQVYAASTRAPLINAAVRVFWGMIYAV